jgi:hypothetical protein
MTMGANGQDRLGGIHEGTIQTEIERATLHREEIEVEVHTLEAIQIGTLYSKGCPWIGLRKTLAAPFLHPCGVLNLLSTHFYSKCIT